MRLVDYVKEAYEKTNISLVGICFGHQIIARALGAEVRRNAGAWEVSVDLVKLTPDGQKIFGVDNLVSDIALKNCKTDLPLVTSPNAPRYRSRTSKGGYKPWQ